MKKIGPFDYSVADASRYDFVRDMQVHDEVFVVAADNRLRSAVGDYSNRWNKLFAVNVTDGGMIVRRVS